MLNAHAILIDFRVHVHSRCPILILICQVNKTPFTAIKIVFQKTVECTAAIVCQSFVTGQTNGLTKNH